MQITFHRKIHVTITFQDDDQFQNVSLIKLNFDNIRVHRNSPKMMPAIPPSEVKMIECHSNLSFIKMMAKEDTPIPLK
jgi:hypothetical protein